MGLFSSSEKSDKARFKKLKEEGCVVTLSIEVPASKVQDETQTIIMRIQQRAKIPGFRPGKAPLDLVKNQFMGHAREEVFDQLARKYVPEALEELKLRPVAVPSVTEVKFDEGKPLNFQVKVEVPPQVAPKDYAKIQVQRVSYLVTEEALSSRMAELREANARLDKAEEEAVAKNHYVVIDYSAAQDGRPLAKAKGESELVDMSSEQTLEGLPEGLLGMKRGQTKDIPVKFNGKDAVLTATLREIKKKILPQLDAEFAKDLGFATLEEFKAKLREVMEAEGKTKTDREVTQQIEEALVKSNRIPLPPSLVEAQLEHMLERLRRQLLGNRPWPEKQLSELKEKMRPQAENEVRISYILPAIAENEKLSALEEDLKSELEKNLAGAENEAKKDEVRKLFEERKDMIAGMIRDRKTMAFLKEKAVYKDA